MNDRFVEDRQELKYIVSLEGMETFLKVVDTDLTSDSHGSLEGYAVHSIYFDDAKMTFFKQKMANLETRMKPRLRIYTHTLCPSPPAIFLEFKYREQGVVSKERVILNEEDATQLLTSNVDHNSLETKDCVVIAKFCELSRRMELTPLVGVRYHRQAFFSNDSGKTRLTFA